MSEEINLKSKKIEEQFRINEDIEGSERLNRLTISDILNSKIRFQIYGLLHIYNEQSLSQLTEKTGKAKSTLHDNLKKMIDNGFVKVREEESKRTLKKKFFSWIHRDEDCCTKKESSKKIDEDYCRTSLKSLKSFAEYNQNILDNWLRFAYSLEDKLDEGKIEEVADILKNIYKDIKPFAAISFYSAENAKKFHQRLVELYNEIPDEAKSQSNNNPYFGGLTLLPIKKVLDYLYPVENIK